ncbi:MAG TPA: prepilin-type N-terminal cleavage/methylation domain-containing protein [Opitutaceae bacterium]|nr:prepilin-type N-terminal cleavage/methylation domain-containing protein [Opitutaceae bacterium]
MLSGRKSLRATGRGFSLLEILIAVALAAMLLVAVNFFVLSMGELWGGGSEERLFDRHVRGVTRFVDSLVQQSVEISEKDAQPSSRPTSQVAPAESRGRAAPMVVAAAPSWAASLAARLPAARWLAVGSRLLAAQLPLGRQTASSVGRFLRVQGVPPPPDTGGRGRLPPPLRDGGTNNPFHQPGGGPKSFALSQMTNADTGSGARFRFGTPAGYDGAPPMLMFEIDEAPGQCVWPQRPLPQVECALQVNADEGLVLLWKSKLEDDYGTGRPRKTQLSPFGRGISFDYYDAERKTWSHTTQPQADGNGGWLVPQRIRVEFAYRGMEREVSITLPEVPEGAPLR